MQILQLLYGAVPTSALCKAGSYIYELVPCTVCRTQLRFPIGESHAQPCTIHLLEPLLHNKAFIYKPRTTVQLIHKSADTFHNVVYRLLTYALYFGTQLRCVHQNRNYETLDIHRALLLSQRCTLCALVRATRHGLPGTTPSTR